VVVKEGTYSEAIIANIPTGTSWDAPFALKASPGEAVTLKPVGGVYRGSQNVVYNNVVTSVVGFGINSVKRLREVMRVLLN
jgi:hypothetical protein